MKRFKRIPDITLVHVCYMHYAFRDGNRSSLSKIILIASVEIRDDLI